MYVSWLDAKAFSEWLTRKDRAARRIGDDLAYRLPTDHEWSCAVGIGEKEDPAIPPRQKGDLLPNVFAWGTSWPPPLGAGNLADQKSRTEGAYTNPTHVQEFIDGYDDGHAFIAPVGSFQPNRLGLHDLAGNVEEHVEDRSKVQNERILRGAHWGAASPNVTKSSFRNACVETGTNHLVGFRVVLAPALVASEATESPNTSVDLLALVDVERDAIAGAWSREGADLMLKAGASGSTSNGNPRLQLPYEPSGEYDFEIEFTPDSGSSSVYQVLSAHGRPFSWVMDAGTVAGRKAGFESIKGELLINRADGSVMRPRLLINGQRHRAKVEVRKSGVRGFLDGELLVSWGNGSHVFQWLDIPAARALRDAHHLGIGAQDRALRIHKATVREITPEAKAAAP